MRGIVWICVGVVTDSQCSGLVVDVEENKLVCHLWIKGEGSSSFMHCCCSKDSEPFMLLSVIVCCHGNRVPLLW